MIALGTSLWENLSVREGTISKEMPDLHCLPTPGLLKIHSGQCSPQQAVLTIPSQLKPLSINTSGGVQTVLMPVNKGASTLVLTSSVSGEPSPSAAMSSRFVQLVISLTFHFMCMSECMQAYEVRGQLVS